MTSKKWIDSLGNLASFDDQGVMLIFKYAKVMQMSHETFHREFQVMGAHHRYMLFTGDGVTIFRVLKKFCKIV